MSSSPAAAALCAVPKDSFVRKVGGGRTVSSRRRVRFSVASALNSREKLRVDVLGASGYTGSEISGMQSTIYVEMLLEVTVEDLYRQPGPAYEAENFMKLLN